ncbi:NAD(P)-dependent glycerol-3-phosphate dehydrogenase [Lichenihabitans sp. Uapishka_5]|uniref:NAD(P)H-dependent glycerol-3-phosphate dehydrogenase n=1 Tax=Lichenihabitans sp. Uapishka_5 TaxID=3037302 RepID=UPI0029E80889|nr:NAD(P)H-dependent glycerol-3-phosphate dehydrogenase [Lichenihabitans sp. Uapishka_5]MDX7953156.1 NAD(P)-dependent glycerol-3-phosphate dehydrogenase [Lichenihabitans sp. Uapishka_5]
MARIGVLGAGAWGTALALVAARAGEEVTLWSRSAAWAARLHGARENARDLPGVALPPTIAVTADPEALRGTDLILAVVPAQALRDTLTTLDAAIRPGTPVVVCAKGLERGSGASMAEVVRACCPGRPPAALSGPSFAADVGAGLPTAVTLAADSLAVAATIARRLATPSFRVYHTDDLAGVEIGGAAKNVLAIACGIAAGRALGASAQAALMARAFAELSRFGQASGARPETLMGLSGLGDLVLTCGSAQSRNFAFGLALGQDATPEAAAGGRLVEGAATAPALRAAAGRLGVAMPIVERVAAVLAGESSVDDAIEALLARPPRAEH